MPPYLRGLGLGVIPLWESDMGAGLRKMIRGSAGAMGQRRELFDWAAVDTMGRNQGPSTFK